MNCPKCGFPRQPESNECPKCGILFDKYEDFIKNKRTELVRKVIVEEKVEEKIEIKEFVKIFLEKLSIKERIESVNVFLKKLSVKKVPQPTSFQKKALILLAVLIIIGIGFIIFKPDIKINGEIFIVKKGGQNIKLGLAEVKVFPMETLLPYLLERKKVRDNQHSILVKKLEVAKKEYEAASKEVENAFNWDFDNLDPTVKAREKSDLKLHKLRTEEKEITSCNFFFRELPVPLISTKTNSDGKFNFLIPGSGSHVIAASATRHALDDEKYYWITTIDPKRGSTQTVILSNDNLVSTDDIEVLIDMYVQKLQ